MEPLGYRFFKGRQGAAGYMRRMDGGCAVCCQGLVPGESYALRALPLGNALGESRADGDGCLVFHGAYPAELFLSQGGQVTLWDGGDEGFLLAQECLRRLRCPVKREEEETKQIETGDMIVLPDLPEMDAQKTPEERPEEEPEERTPEKPLPDYSLRSASAAAPVDGLPPLLWPKGTEHVQKYFQLYPPIRLFDEPQWRFVRTPSPIRQAAYCAVGRHVAGDAVDALAYAVPGGPYNPPAPLPGYQYRMGKEGMGYWVMRKKAEK